MKFSSSTTLAFYEKFLREQVTRDEFEEYGHLITKYCTDFTAEELAALTPHQRLQWDRLVSINWTQLRRALKTHFMVSPITKKGG